MALAIVGIGSNKGHRRSQIERAVALISSIEGITDFRCSGFFESEPWGYESEAMYLNVCVGFEIDTDPFKLFAILSDIEKTISTGAHRDEYGNYIDREIDIDFIAFGTAVINSPGLTLPHPRAHLRDFVMIPFMEIAPRLAGEIKAFLTDDSA